MSASLISSVFVRDQCAITCMHDPGRLRFMRLPGPTPNTRTHILLQRGYTPTERSTDRVTVHDANE